MYGNIPIGAGTYPALNYKSMNTYTWNWRQERKEERLNHLKAFMVLVILIISTMI